MSELCRIFISDSYDPWFNLATEEWLFRDMQSCDHILFLWRNQDTVVIGRSQNPWSECHLDDMKKDGVRLARRQSGGGAVFHDLGNTNFTFLSKKSLYDKARNLSIITNALKTLDIDAYPSGRNDVLVGIENPRKISGNAFKEKSDRAFHHGTILVSADLNKLARYLNPDKKKLESKGVKSVRSRVQNVIELNSLMTHESLCGAIIESFNHAYQSETEIELLNTDQLKARADLNEQYEEWKSWDWVYGQTLPFTHKIEHRFSWGGVEIQCVVKSAMIIEAKVYSDALATEWLDDLERSLINVAYDVSAMREATLSLTVKWPERTAEIAALAAVILE
jgi:lipoate---protein ligase